MSGAVSIESDAKALVALNAWQRTMRCNWALVSQLSDEPMLVHVECASDREKGPVAGRLMFFPGFAAYRDFAILKQAPDMGFALTNLDIRHYELIALKDGGYELHAFKPGFVPRPADEATRALLAPLVHECLGLMMRFEEETELVAKYKDENALFARFEGLDGKWKDGPLPVPQKEVRNEERITLGKSECAAAAHLPFSNNEAWEVDFYSVPACHTNESEPRILYLFAAVDAATGLVRCWERLSVDPKGEGGLKPLWESLAQRLLKAILANGRIPGAVGIRSGRMARFLRPLGLQIPFRLVHHRQLPALDAALRRAVQGKKV